MAKKSKMKRKSNGKTAASRTTARSAKKTSRTASKTTAKKTATPMKLPSFREPLSKSTMIKTITDVTCLGKKDVVAVDLKFSNRNV